MTAISKAPVSTTTETPTAKDEIDSFLSDSDSLKSLVIQDGPPVIKPRPYQKEMLQESLKRNIIVAMDTGSGKTHIAVMRIQHELEHIPSHQIIWFLATTVALCEQQYNYITSQVVQVQSKFLSGADNVDRWTEQKHWDAILKNIRIVVSTYQILLDALNNGFVPIQSLALIVFDEVHNCVSKHPGAKIMSNFYHPRKASGQTVPHILGLTASPVMRSNPRSLVEIERTMDAICRTPSKHRAELRLEVKLPVLLQVTYDATAGITGSKSIASLGKAFGALNILEDPSFLSLLKNNTERGRAKAHKVRLSGNTWCSSQVKTLHGTALKINQHLGAWAADYYIAQVIEKITKVATGANKYGNVWDASGVEKRYLAKSLQDVEISRHACLGFEDLNLVSDKVAKLIEVLLQETAGFQGIVFVQERATASVLAHLLSVHPSTSDKFRIGTIVGTSAHAQRSRNISELVDIGEQKHTISKFRSGKINLAVATSVLEEGIDVPACNAVICFQLPANLKSFVQRRGRARHRDSKLVLMDCASDKSVDWQQLEADMKEMYEDEMRTLQEFLVSEDADESGTETMVFRVAETQALLDLDNAIPHLYHFCAKLPRTAYVDPRPEFICSPDGSGRIRARVTLPLCVDQSVREAESKLSWQSEKNAMKDAAFQAYFALYSAKLVNDHLLPSLVHDDLLAVLRASPTDTRASLVRVREQLNPWVEVAKEWNNDSVRLYQSTIKFDDLEITMLLPVPIPQLPPIEVQWDSTTEFSMHITARTGDPPTKVDTWALLQSAFGARFPIEQKPNVVEFSANTRDLKDLMGKQDVHGSNLTASTNVGLMRDKLDPHAAYVLKESLAAKPDIKQVQNPYNGYEIAPDCPHLSLVKVPRRANFVQRLSTSSNPPSSKPYSTVLPTARCTMDEMPFKYYQFGRLIPVIMKRCEKYLLASILTNTILKDVQISDLDLVATAISASSAGDETNYQRLEFLGDTVLKMCTSVQLMAQYPLWHEGYLSEMKGRMVSNSSLYTAAIKAGLDRFIITKQFNGHHWRPLYVDDALRISNDGQRELSSKIPADVVESLIGVSMLDGGIPKALICLQTFLPRPDWTWQPFEARRMTLLQRIPDVELPTTLQPLEILIGYTFHNKGLLLEAMTHASCNSGSASLERLEFLGDAILDHLVVAALWNYNLSHIKMHLMRTALVNADILAFLGMEWFIEQEVVDLVSNAERHFSPRMEEVHKTAPLALWQFMRHASSHIGTEQQATSLRHSVIGPHIRTILAQGSHYPWALLSRLQAQKFYSDIVESLIAAVWIDSGSFDACNQIVERMGIFKLMRRMLDEDVQVLNPKEELGMLADTQKVKYVVARAPAREEEGSGSGEMRFLCSVFVGEREVVAVRDGVSVVEVETRAAEEAVRVLKAERMECVDGVGGDGEADGDEDEDKGEDGVVGETEMGADGGDVEMDGA
ncbi:dicer-like protein-like protein 2 [Rhexocercosporidium sp. MPI-PUGE-AT-0058]|nr:dicer-like protein-like protein 2 [Rhexocercosporidium sp. MPI-PUGE-AT-0058]